MAETKSAAAAAASADALPQARGPLFQLKGCPPRHATPLVPLRDDAELRVQIVAVESVENDVAWEIGTPAATKPCVDVTDDAYFARAIEVAANPAVTCPSWLRQHTVQMHCRDTVGRSYHIQVHVPITMAVVFPETHGDFDRDVVGCFRQMEKGLRLDTGSLCNGELRRRFAMRSRSNNWIPSADDKTKPKEYPVALVSFKNRSGYNKAKKFLEETSIPGREGFEYHVTLWETTDYVKAQTRFLLENDLTPGGWVRVGKSAALGWTCSTCDVERWCLPADIVADHADQSICPLTKLSFDLEVRNGTAADRVKMKALGLDKFPNAINPTNAIIQISVVVETADGRTLRFLLELDDQGVHSREDAYEKRVFDGDEYTVIYFQHEEDMIVFFRDMIIMYDPDLLVSFNGDRFDWPYLVARMGDRAPRDRHGRFFQMGRVLTNRWETQYTPYKTTADDVAVPIVSVEPDDKKKKAGASTQLPRKHFPIAQLATERGVVLTPDLRGRVSLDLCGLIRGLSTADKYLAFKNYTLDNMAARFLGDHKVNFGHNDIFDAWNGVMPGQRMLKILSGKPAEADTSWMTDPAPHEADVDSWLRPSCGLTLADLRAAAQTNEAALREENRRRAVQRDALRALMADPDTRPAAASGLATKIEGLRPVAHADPVTGVTMAAQRRLLGDYCMKDSMLPLRIAAKLGTVMFLWQVARVSSTAPHNVINNGQMMRATTLFIKEAWRQGRVVNRVINRAKGYQGATVLPPKRGYYGGASMDDPPLHDAAPISDDYDVSGISPEELVQRLVQRVVLTLDFKSLYPSIIRAHKLCPSLLHQPDEPVTPSEQSALDFRRHMRVISTVERTRVGKSPELGEPGSPVATMNESMVRHELQTRQSAVVALRAEMSRPSALARHDAIHAAIVDAEHALPALRARLAAMADEGVGTDAECSDDDDDDDDDDGDDDDGDDDGVDGTDEGHESGVITGLPDAADYLTVCVVATDKSGREVGRRYHKYSAHGEGIFPVMLKALLDGRSIYKKKKALEKAVHSGLKAFLSQPLDEGAGDMASMDLEAGPPLVNGEPDESVYADDLDALRAQVKAVLGDEVRIVEVVAAWAHAHPWIYNRQEETLLILLTNYKIFDGRQLALKVMANSIYGVSGAKQQTPCACCQLAESVTAIGRQMIQKSKVCAEVTFAKYGCEVIYGDTDSIFILILQADDKAAAAIGVEIAKYITDVVLNDGVNDLEFECLKKYLALFKKKNYVGLECEDVESGEYERGEKGVSTVRRDKPEVLNKLMRKLNKALTDLGRLPRQTIARIMLRICTTHFERLVRNELPVDDYTIVQRINKMTKRSAHLVMAEKMAERTDMPIIRGDAVSYAHIVDKRFAKATERVETPVIIKQRPDVHIDRGYYLENKVSGIVRSTLGLFMPAEVIDLMFDVYQYAVDNPRAQTLDEQSGMYASPSEARSHRVESALSTAIAEGRIPHSGWFPTDRGKKRKVKATPAETEAERRSNKRFFKDYLGTLYPDEPAAAAATATAQPKRKPPTTIKPRPSKRTKRAPPPATTQMTLLSMFNMDTE